jgi:predicted DNA-binding transcriptional regulator AlpA
MSPAMESLVTEQLTGLEAMVRDRIERAAVRMTGEYLLSIDQVAVKVSLGETYIREQVKLGAFPQPAIIKKSIVRWKGSDIDAWIAEVTSRMRSPRRTP